MRREAAKTTHGGAPGKPDWRKEIADNLDHIATAVTGDSVSMDFGYYEALGVMERLAKPTVTYTVDVQNLSGVSGYEQERFTLDTALRIWDEALE